MELTKDRAPYMDAGKFTDTDRGLVLRELEHIQKTKLVQVKPSRKLFVDGNGLPFLIFGGKEYWHGITANGLKDLDKCKKEGALVIVKKFNTRLDINVGSLSVFLSNLDRLQKTKTGNIQFHYIIADETNKIKFEREIKKSPFHKIRQDYIFKNYQELDEFFESVKNFAQIQEKFLQKDVV
jgi:hypothetical protein